MKHLPGKILKLFISKSGYDSRLEKASLELDTGGVCEDKFHGKDIKRSVLITSTLSYDKARENWIDIKLGELGENILVDFNPYNLELGTRLQIGEVILEISQHGTLCKSLCKVHSKLPKLLKDNRGIFAKVIKEGRINNEDPVCIL